VENERKEVRRNVRRLRCFEDLDNIVMKAIEYYDENENILLKNSWILSDHSSEVSNSDLEEEENE
jgi:hypothetical protein